MKRVLFILFAGYLSLLPATAQTLEECQQAAAHNYPMIRQYDLIGKTTALTIANIQKGWLPKISVQAQATYQSDVTAWPDQMQTMMQQAGIARQVLVLFALSSLMAVWAVQSYKKNGK